MGSCFSTGANSALKNHHNPSPSDQKLRSNAVVLPPPPPQPEEETVKEVMSETPKSKPQIPKLDRESSKRITRPDMHKTREQEENGIKKPQPMKENEVSDVSGSSQAASTVTAAKSEKGSEVLRRSKSKLRSSEFTGEMKPPPKSRNNAVSDVVKERNMTVNKSSSRRYDRSPVKRSEPSPIRARQNLGQRKDPGEISGRRSYSPATLVVENGCGRSTVLGRSLSGRKTGSSSGRFRSDQSVRIRKMGDVTDKEEKWPAAMPPPTVKESLENPLVSLECYIFF